MFGPFVNDYTALLDACVIGPMPACDTPLLLAEQGFFVPKWSPAILEEVARYMRGRQRSEEQIQHRLNRMAAAFEDACIQGYEILIDSMISPDADDSHVLAAAVRGRVDVIVTDNITDFPPDRIEPYGIIAQTFDDFLVHQYHLNPDLFIRVLRSQSEMRRIEFSKLIANLTKKAPTLPRLIGA